MNKPSAKPSLLGKIMVAVLAFMIAGVIVLVAQVFKSVVWPLLKLCVKALFNMLRKAFARVKLAKVARPAQNLPTPAIFEGAKNLAPAKELRL